MMGSLKPVDLIRYFAALWAWAVLGVGVVGADVVFLNEDDLKRAKADVEATFEIDVDAVSVIRFDGDYDRGVPVLNAAPRQAVAAGYYGAHPDTVDFLVVFTTFGFDLAGASAFYVNVQNDIEGLNIDSFDFSNLFGSGDHEPGRLHGYIDMGRLTDYELDPRRPGYDSILGVLAHEVQHRWCCRVDIDRPDLGADALIGQDGSHWSDLLSTGASLMYGHDWRDNGDGTFTSVAIRKLLGPLDLYLAGFLTPAQVPDSLLIENPSLDPTVLPEEREVVSGTARSVSIEDVISANGSRVPGASASQKTFRAGFILLARSGEEIDPDHLAAMDRIRRDFAERFAVLTGGAGRFELFPEGEPDHEPGEPTGGPGGGDLRPEPADVPLALSWLRSQQDADGSWLDTLGTSLRDTHEVLATLSVHDPAFTGEADARAWLSTQEQASIDMQARLLLAGIDGDAAMLVASQNAGGGFGAGTEHLSTAFDTSLALLALGGSTGFEGVVEGAIPWLLAAQSPAGGWPHVGSGPARTVTTVSALRALLRHGLGFEPSVSRALAFLASKQNSDGGFGDSPSTVHDTAAVLDALLALDAAGLEATSTIDRGSAEGYLTSRQTVEGSWDGSVYATALAIRALEAGRLPNLIVESLSADPETPRDGERVLLTASLSNGGGASAEAVLSLFDGEPAAGGALLEERALGVIAPGERRLVVLEWDTLDQVGAHWLYVVADLSGAVEEADEADNRAFLDIEVAEAPAGVDLEAGASDLAILPENPDHLPADLGIVVRVRNVGQEDASGVLVRLWRIEPDRTVLVLEETVDVLSRSSTPIPTTDRLETPGTTMYTLVLDPDDTITEADENNNFAERNVETAPNLDIAVGQLSASGALQVGGDVVLTAAIRNRGTLDLERPVDVVFAFDDGISVQELGRRSIFLGAGEASEVVLLWRADREGDFAIRAALDLSGSPIILDSDPSNDSAELALSIGSNTLPNLHLSPQQLTLTPLAALEGSPLEITAMVENTGAAIGTFTVFLWAGHPDEGQAISAPVQVDGLDAGGSAEAHFTWPRVPDDVDRLLTLIVAPDVATAEISDDDNTLLIPLPILSLPDPSVSAAALSLDPAFPSPGASVTLSALVANLGEQAAAALLVRAVDEAGQVLAEATLTLDGAAQATVPLTFSAPELQGLWRVSVVLDPLAALEEGSEANNTATLEIGVQDGDIVVEPRFISPDGDGVQDEALLIIRTLEPVAVEILDELEEIVRTLSFTPSAGEARGAWDGRDEHRRLVRDGAYLLRVVAGEDELSQVLGQIQVTVDTNRAPLLDALGSELADERCLTCGLPDPGAAPQMTADEQYLFFSITAPEGGYPAGVYRVSVDGAAVEPLFTVDGRLRVVDLEAAPRGDLFYVSVSDPVVPENGFREIRGLDGYVVKPVDFGIDFDFFGPDGRHFYDLRSGELYRYESRDLDAPGVLVGAWPRGSAGHLSPGRRRLLVSDQGGREWWTLDIESGVLAALSGVGAEEALADPVWSHDGTRVAFQVEFLNVGEGETPPPDAIATYTRSGGFLSRFDVPQDAVSGELAARIIHPAATAGTSLRDFFWDGGSERLSLRLAWSDLFDSGQGGYRFSVVEADSGTVVAGFWSDPDLTPLDAGLTVGLPEKEDDPDDDPDLEPYFGASRQLWVPGNQSVLLWRGPAPATAAYLLAGRRSFETAQSRQDFQTVGSGHMLHFRRPDPESAFDTDWWQLRTLANLTADLRLRRNSDGRTVILEGTAADQHFAAYQLDYAPLDDPQDWRPIAPPSARQVVDEVFLPWASPAEGTWRVRLTVSDQAGNRRQTVRQVATGLAAGVVDVFAAPERFSPNNDGVFDEAIVHYQTLGPWQVDFQVLSSSGQILLSRSRTHLEAENGSFAWDGRDHFGQQVPDGVYRLKLENFEFTLIVDTTAPGVAIRLFEPWSLENGPESTPKLFAQVLKSSAQEPVDAYLERSIDGGSWTFFADAFTASIDRPELLSMRQTVEIAEAVFASYRIVAQDDVGNHALLATPEMTEKLILPTAGNHRTAADGSLLTLTWAVSPSALQSYLAELQDGLFTAQLGGLASPPILVDGTSMRFELIETLREPVIEVALEYRPKNTLDPWASLPVEGFLLSDGSTLAEPTEHRFRFALDLGGLPLRALEFRVRAEGVSGASQTSQRFQIQPPTGCPLAEFHGLLTDPLADTLVLDPGCYDVGLVQADLADMLLELGVDPAQQTVLWASETLLPPIDEATLFVRSDGDPDFAVPRLLRPAAERDWAMLFLVDFDCEVYMTNLRLVTEPVEQNGEIAPIIAQTSDSVRFAEQCLDLLTSTAVHTATSCDQQPPGRATLTLQGQGEDLDVLRLVDEAGLTVFSQVAPVSGMPYEVELDLDDQAEGLRRFDASVTNAQGRTVTREVVVPVDRSAPTLAVTAPADGASLCALSAHDGTPCIEIDVSAIDSFVDAVNLLPEDRPGAWPPWPASDLAPLELGLSVNGGDVSASAELVAEVGAFVNPEPIRLSLERVPGSVATDIALQVVGIGGHRICTERTFFVDAVADAVTIPGPVFFSPDGDGVLDRALLSLQPGEEALEVDIAIVPGEIEFSSTGDPRGCAVAAGDSVASLVTDLAVPGTSAVDWDGTHDSGGVAGGVASPGCYYASTLARDACGNATERLSELVLDITPPALSITHPAPGPVAASFIEIGWLASDDFGFVASGEPAVTVQLFYGLGAAPVQWLPLSEPLWNTVGLPPGEYSLRVVAQDRAGNRIEQRRIVELDPKDLVTYFEAEPALFSPGDDGRFDQVSARFGLARAGRVQIDIVQSGAIVRALSDGDRDRGSHVLAWDGRDDAGLIAPDGEYGLRLRAYEAGSSVVAQEELITVTLDATAPSITVERPLVDGFLRPSDEVLAGIADERLEGWTASLAVASVVPVWEQIASGFGPGLRLPTQLPGGSYLLRIEASDLAGNQSMNTTAFDIDETAPVVAWTAPATRAVLGPQSSPVSLSGLALDEYLADVRFELGVGEAPASWMLLAAPTPDSSGQISQAWDVTSLADGLYTLRLVAEDEAGHRTERLRPVEIDATAPLASITAPLEGDFITGPTSILGTASDANLRFFEVELAPAGSATWSVLGIGVEGVTNGQLHAWQSLPSDGAYDLRLRVEDLAGNLSEAQISIFVDTEPPSPPTGLVAEIQDNGARLSWQASASQDVVSYRVYRDGVQRAADIVATDWSEPSLGEGRFVYTVTAVDRAGQESEPSNASSLEIDRTPPQVSIFAPGEGLAVAGLVEIRGTAFAADLFQYTLEASPEGGGLAIVLRQSPLPVQVGRLGDFDTSALVQGSRWTLRLTAGDTSGNSDSAVVTVEIDNLPPAAPSELTATLSAIDEVTLAWQPPADTDIAGYLLYRDGRLANATGPVIGDLAPYLIEGTGYVDSGLPDGTFTYRVYAVDHAANQSFPSNPDTATIETGPPAVSISSPAAGARFDQPRTVTASSKDEDLANVHFEMRAGGDWALLETASAAPWEAFLDPDALSLVHGDIDLRAIGTDEVGNTDPAPVAITVTYTDVTPPAIVSGLAARVDGGNVQLTWNPDTTDSDPAAVRYYVERQQGVAWQRLTSSPLSNPSYLDAGLDDGERTYGVIAVDVAGNEATRSEPVTAQVYTPALDAPFSPTTEPSVLIAGSVASSASIAITVAAPSGSLELATSADGAGRFALPLALEMGTQLVSVVAESSGNRSKLAQSQIIQALRPAQPQNLIDSGIGDSVALTWDPNIEPDLLGYRLFENGDVAPADLPLVLSASDENGSVGAVTDSASATFWTGEDESVLEIDLGGERYVRSITLSWRVAELGEEQVVRAAGTYRLEARHGPGWVVLERAVDDLRASPRLELADGYRTDRLRLVIEALRIEGETPQPAQLTEVNAAEAPITLIASSWTASPPPGRYQYQVSAVSLHGLESPRSDATPEREIGDVTPPAPPILQAVLDGFDGDLSWTGPADAVSYEIERNGVAVQTTAALSWRDLDLPNGMHTYAAFALDAAGNRSIASNEVTLIVERPLPGPPTIVSFDAFGDMTGGIVRIEWLAGPGPAPATYGVWRASQPGGPYTELVRTSGTVAFDIFEDTPPPAPVLYYVIVAYDTGNNASEPSAEQVAQFGDEPAGDVELFYPVPSVRSFEATGPVQTIAGMASAGAAIELRLENDLVATAIARTTTAADRVGAGCGSILERSWVSSDGRFLWIDCGTEHQVVDFESFSVTPVDLFGAGTARFVPYTNQVLFTTSTGEVHSYDVQTGVSSLLLAGDIRLALAVPEADPARPSPVDRLIVLARHDGFAGLWDVNTSLDTWTLIFDLGSGFDDVVTESLDVSPGGRFMVWLRGTRVELLEVATGLRRRLTSLGDTDAMPGFAWDISKLIYFEAYDSGGGGLTGGGLPGGSGAAFGLLKLIERMAWLYDVETGTTTELPFYFTRRARLTPWSGWAAAVEAGEGMLLSLLSLDGEEAIELDGFFVSTAQERARPTVSASGHLFLVVDGEAMRYTPEGRFEVKDQPLAPGANRYTAADSSSESEAITILAQEVGEPLPPDLTLELLAVPSSAFAGDTVRVTAIVRNVGEGRAEDSDLSLAAIRPDGLSTTLASFMLVPALEPAATTLMTFDLAVPLPGAYQLSGLVDTAEQIPESDEINNEASFSLRALDPTGGTTVDLSTDRAIYGMNDRVGSDVTVVHSGVDPFSGLVRVWIEDQAGVLVTELGSEDLALEFGDVALVTFEWPTSMTFAGSYQVRAALESSQAEAGGEASALFTIAPVIEISALLRANASSFLPGATARLEAQLAYSAGNVALAGAVATLSASGPSGEPLASLIDYPGILLPGSSAAFILPLSIPAGSLGLHSATFDLHDADDQLLAHAEVTFLVSPSPVVLAGSLDVAPMGSLGQILDVGWQVTQVSGSSIGTLPVRVELRQASNGQLVSSDEQPVTLPAAGTASLETEMAEPDGYLVTLSAVLPEGTISLDVAAIELADETPPSVRFLQPLHEAFIGSDTAVVVEASDAHSALTSVALQVEGGEWRALDQGATSDRFIGDLDALFPGLGDGESVLMARARDAARLEAFAEVSVTIDRTSPVITISGVQDDGVYLAAISPAVVVEEIHPSTLTVTLDGIPLDAESFAAIEALGAHTLAAFATDFAGNSASQVVGFIVASLSAGFDAPAAVPLGDVLTVDWQLLAVDEVALPPMPFMIVLETLDGDLIAQASGEAFFQRGEASGQVSLATVGAGLGEHRLRIDVTAASGTHLITVGAVKLIDVVPPGLTIDRPAAGALVGADGSIQATADDTLTGVIAVEFQVDAGGWQLMSLAGGSYVADLGNLADGSHLLEVRATDGAGLATIRDRSFTVDRSAPTITITGVEDDAAYLEPVTIDIEIEDAHPGTTAILLDGESFVSGSTVDSGGAHTLEIESEDQAGNRAERSLSFTITLDAVSPRVLSVTWSPGPSSESGAESTPLLSCDSLQAAVKTIEVRFSEPIPAAATSGEDVPFQLVRPGQNRIFETIYCDQIEGDDLAVPLALTANSAASIQLDAPGRLLTDDAYRLRICGDLTDEAGNPLDGNGDGIGGDDFLRYFRIDRSNLLDNGHFDCEMDSWQIEPDGTVQIDQNQADFEAAPHSGSARIAFAAEEGFALGQCVWVDPARNPYRWTSRLRLDAGPGIQAVIFRRCDLFNGPGCAGEGLGDRFDVLALANTDGNWIDKPQPFEFNLPETAASAFCAIEARSLDEAIFELYLDAVHISPSDQPAFADGFEAGDVSAWSEAAGLQAQLP